ncbi:MAG: hypothetical protein Q8R26_00090 [bacterium]|nr:hypothetical protein [bacterium]
MGVDVPKIKIKEKGEMAMKTKNRRGLAEGSSQDVMGPLQDIIRQVREGELVKEHLQAFSEHRNPFPKKEKGTVLIPFKYDKTKDGWTLIEDVPFDGKQFIPDIVEFLKPRGFRRSAEIFVSGKVMRQRAKKLNANLGQRHAEYLLDYQELIPKEWQGEYNLAFPGTIWRGSRGDRYVPRLYWYDDRWCMDPDFGWLRYSWCSGDRLVRPRG